jgi:hypothetical protein
VPITIGDRGIEAAIRPGLGVLVLYSLSNRDNPAQVTVFEIYRDREAYLAHLPGISHSLIQGPVEKMIKSLKLVPVDPVILGTKAKSGSDGLAVCQR